MTRHARNCTAGAVYTYHERKKDTKQSGYGSKDVRLGKDSIKVLILRYYLTYFFNFNDIFIL